MGIEEVIKQKTFKDNYQKAMINLFYTSNFFRDSHVHLFNEYKIQGQHFNVLRILKGKYPDPVSPGYIKDVILDKGRDITRLIDKLQDLGWVHRCVCPENKRMMDIYITNEGINIVNKISEKMDRHDQQLRNLSEAEYQTLSDLLDKMRG